MSIISEWFWSERLWLPKNVTWSDVMNSPGKSVVYADINDFLFIFPLMLLIFLARYLLDRYIFTPLGKILKIQNKHPGKVQYNAKLEAAYLSSKKTDFSILSKQLGITERQIERWWRLRSNQDKPSKLRKFRECTWRAVFYIWATAYGLYFHWDKEWFWNNEKSLEGWPHQGVTDDLRWYYMFQNAAIWCELIFQFRGVKRKDSWQMYIHHVATICLLSVSWICNAYRVGTLILLIHDCGDITLEIGKSLKYAKYDKACNCVFVLFIIVWIATRIVIYPKYFNSTLKGDVTTFGLFCLLRILLWVLYFLHVLWTYYILKIAYKALRSGGVDGDSRSSDSEVEISHRND